MKEHWRNRDQSSPDWVVRGDFSGEVVPEGIHNMEQTYRVFLQREKELELSFVES